MVAMRKFEPQKASKKAKISVYYESLCPGCIIFLVGSLRAAIVQEDWDKIMDIELVPFGLTNTHYEGLNMKMSCSTARGNAQ